MSKFKAKGLIYKGQGYTITMKLHTGVEVTLSKDKLYESPIFNELSEYEVKYYQAYKSAGVHLVLGAPSKNKNVGPEEANQAEVKVEHEVVENKESTDTKGADKGDSKKPDKDPKKVEKEEVKSNNEVDEGELKEFLANTFDDAKLNELGLKYNLGDMTGLATKAKIVKILGNNKEQVIELYNSYINNK